MPERRVQLGDSTREPVRGARRVAAADPNESVTVTVLLKRRSGASPAASTEEARSLGNSEAERRQRRQAFTESQGASTAAMDKVKAFAEEHGLKVQEADAARRSVVLTGTVQQATQAFDVDLGRYESADGNYRGREGAISLPPDIADVVEGVFGLDDRPQAAPNICRGPSFDQADLVGHLRDAQAEPEVTGAHPFWPPQVAKLYNFPLHLTGAGETIAIIELGGGFDPAELTRYFKHVKVKAPKVKAVSVDNGSNRPGADPGADGEVLLDIEVAGSIAHGANIVVYFADNTDRGFLDAITTAVHSQSDPASVISISWGGPEAAWTKQSISAFDAAFADANALGVTVLCAAGDHGAADAFGDGKAYADFPASSPHVVACGGTRVLARRGHIVEEEVWNDGDGWATGGGISQSFKVPPYQASVVLPAAQSNGHAGRGVPDVAGNADQPTGYLCFIDGKTEAVGGTSAVAPLYAALTALLNQGLGHPVADLTSSLYEVAAGSSGAAAFHDVTAGDNSVPQSGFGPATAGYSAGTGWDACTGLGSIDGEQLLKAL